MPFIARAIYAALIWQERRRARARLAVSAPPPPRATPAHLETGRRGERLAYWRLRSIGYTVVARNLSSRPGVGELDIVAWEGPVLCFVEVKTRSSGDAGPPEAALTFAQRKRIIAAAQIYMRNLKQKNVNYRFDVVSVAWKPECGFQVQLIRDAFKN
jgi:putative endonuclease